MGDEVNQGQTIATVRDNSVMTLKVPFPADDAKEFYVGQSATVTLDSTFETLSGTVTAVSGANIVGSGNMITRNVTVEVSNSGGLTDAQAASVSINGVNGSGNATFTYRTESTVTAEASGTVLAVNAPEGTSVTKNQAVLTLGGDDLDDQIQSASESLQNAELSMENTRNQLENYTITSPISGTIVDKQYKLRIVGVMAQETDESASSLQWKSDLLKKSSKPTIKEAFGLRRAGSLFVIVRGVESTESASTGISRRQFVHAGGCGFCF